MKAPHWLTPPSSPPTLSLQSGCLRPTHQSQLKTQPCTKAVSAPATQKGRPSNTRAGSHGPHWSHRAEVETELSQGPSSHTSCRALKAPERRIKAGRAHQPFEVPSKTNVNPESFEAGLRHHPSGRAPVFSQGQQVRLSKSRSSRMSEKDFYPFFLKDTRVTDR